MQTSKTRRYRQNPRTAGRVIDGVAFVVTPDDNKLHTLNRTGTFIWELAHVGCTIEEIASSLSAQFTVEADAALRDATSFCEDMVSRGILEVS